MKQFNKAEVEQHINKMLKKHNIEVYGWSSTSSGRAKVKSRKVKIPKPTNIDRFAVCLHEIFHVISKKGSKSFEKEFYCDMYALDTLKQMNLPVDRWIIRMRWHVLSRIAMAHNRGLNHANINQEIRLFFSEIDFAKWIGKKVYVGHKYWESNNPDDIELYPNMSFITIQVKLQEKGFKVIKSTCDDSTYGNYIVSKIPAPVKHGEEFETLHDIIKAFKLS